MNRLFNTYDGFEFNSNNEFVVSDNIFEEDLNQLFSQINHKFAIEYRDELIAYYLKKAGIKSLFDIGPDNCVLLLKAKKLGLQVAGIDVTKKAIDISQRFDLNVRNFSLEELLKYINLHDFYKDFNISIPQSNSVAISCLNLIHGKWEDTNLRDELLDFIFRNGNEVIITCYENDLQEIVKKYNIKSFTRLHHYKDFKVSYEYATALQYGTTFNKKNKIIEKLFSKFNNIYFSNLFNGHKFIEKIQPYVALTVIIKN